MMSKVLTRCPQRKQPVLSVKHAKSGFTAYLDPEPNQDGNCLLHEQRTYDIVKNDELNRAAFAGRLYVNHLATCAYYTARRGHAPGREQR